MKTIAVAGNAGYVGSILTKKLLDRGYAVRGMDNFYRNTGDSLLDLSTNPNFEFFRGDVTCEKDCHKLCEGIDGIINCAALVGAPIVDRNVKLAYLVNTEGAVNLLKARTNDCPYIFCSSGSVYGAVEGVCTEQTKCRTTSAYGVSKLKAELELLKHNNVICLRFATGMGVSPNIRLDLLINDFIWKAYHEKSLTVFQADFRRVFIDVKDMADCLIFSLEHCTEMQEYKVFNAGDESLNMTKRELASLLNKKTGCYISYADKGYIDPDQRDYEVSTARIKSFGWHTNITMEQSINDVLKVVPWLLPQNNHYTNKI